MSTVTVGCTVPNGIVLSLPFAKDPAGRTFALTGPASTGAPAAFTPDVDADFFDAWMKEHAGDDVVASGSVFLHQPSAA